MQELAFGMQELASWLCPETRQWSAVLARLRAHTRTQVVDQRFAALKFVRSFQVVQRFAAFRLHTCSLLSSFYVYLIDSGPPAIGETLCFVTAVSRYACDVGSSA